jgi:hypothetical protein
VWKDMLAEGLSCGLHRIERLMRLQAGSQALQVHSAYLQNA